MAIRKIKEGENFSRKHADMSGMAEAMGGLDTTYDPKLIEDDWKKEMDENHEWWESMEHVDKPEYLIKKHAKEESLRQGYQIDKIPTPLRNKVIVAMEKDKPVTNGGIIVTKVIKQPEINKGTVISLNPNTEYDYEVGAKVIIDLRMVTGRLNYNGICLVMHKEGILAEYE